MVVDELPYFGGSHRILSFSKISAKIEEVFDFVMFYKKNEEKKQIAK
jgi:hypothetical protein